MPWLKISLVTSFVYLFVCSAVAQTHLIAFTGKDANAPDEFAFVAVRDRKFLSFDSRLTRR